MFQEVVDDGVVAFVGGASITAFFPVNGSGQGCRQQQRTRHGVADFEWQFHSISSGEKGSDSIGTAMRVVRSNAAKY
jgi:hypothetical protein